MPVSLLHLRSGFLWGTLVLLLLLLEPGLSKELKRTARFYKGTVTTSRVKYRPKQEHSGRQLLDKPEPVQAFVVGYESTEEDAVAAKLASMGKESSIVIMQDIPDDHWVVKARLSDIEALQAAFPNVTASILPSWVKASEGVDTLLESLHQKYGAAASSGTSDRPSWLERITGKGKGKGLELHTTTDGRMQVVIALQVTPFASMGGAARGEVNFTAAIAEAAAWAADLAAQLRSHLRTPDSDPCAPSVEPAWIFGAASARVCADQAPQAADWLLVQPSVVWVDLQKALNKADFHANIAVQDGAVREALTGDTNKDASNYVGLAKYWAKGLTGAGQVSGVTDTGIDMDSCHFWDPEFVDYKTSNVSSTMGDTLEFQQFKSSEHRKVDAYFFFGNKIDESNHGTHVASTLAGSAWNPATQQPFDFLTNPDYATGIAPGARLSFFDIETSEDASDGFLSLPNGIEMFHAMYRQGVKVISNSWGGDTGNYNTMCTLYDAYTWFLQDLTLIAASGNEGLSGLKGDGITLEDLRRGTVSVPGSCKNIMSVGATENWAGPWTGSDNSIKLLGSSNQQINPPRDFFKRVSERDGSGRAVEYMAEFKAYDANGTERGNYMLRVDDENGIIKWPRQNSLQGFVGQEIEVARAGASPSTACEALDPSNYTQGLMLVFIQSSDCSALDQANNIINNGNSSVGGIMVDAGNNLGSVPDPDLTDNRAFAYIKGSDRLLEMLDRTDLTTRLKVFKVSPQESVATFSSFGALRFDDQAVQNTQDLRTQPTVVAPGYALSSNGNGYTGQMDSCEVTTLPGSSMATPVVAGTATLIRQYFQDGFYPSGDKDSSKGFEPTAALMQAMIVGSTDAMIGSRGASTSSQSINKFISGPLLELPSQGRFRGQHTGWGRVSLKGLKLNGPDFDPNWGLQVIQKASHNKEGQKHVYTIQATGLGPLIVTMVYMDYPANPNVRPLLVNDLDLKVIGPSGSEQKEWWGNDIRDGDGLNNIEKVIIEYPDVGEYAIEVRSRKLFIDARPQPYALAIMGGIEGEVDSPFNPARASSSAPSAGGDEVALQQNERVLNVRFLMNDDAQAQRVVSNTSHLEFESRTVQALQSKADSSIVSTVELRSASVEESLAPEQPPQTKRRQLLQSKALVAEFKFTAANGKSGDALATHMAAITQSFPLATADAVDNYFGTDFSSDFLVLGAEGSILPNRDLSNAVYAPPPPAEGEPTGMGLSIRVGLAALLGCLLLNLMLAFP
mmetsp:Transcript_26802/g.72380  ORF Transcript_26802/g.72380 Transcript_26802/m.72380 type:complete len:1245 (+) Transcript_26802:101-3835(+)